QALRARQRIARRICEPIDLATSGTWLNGKRIVVCTHTGIPFSKAGQWDILLLPCGEQAVGVRATVMIARMEYGPIYACVDPRRGADADVRLGVEMLAGPVISALHRPGFAVKSILVAMPPVPVTNAPTALERKRAHYWLNRRRNARIAALAANIISGKW